MTFKMQYKKIVKKKSLENTCEFLRNRKQTVIFTAERTGGLSKMYNGSDSNLSYYSVPF